MKSKNNSIIFIIVILAVVMVATLSVIVYLRMCNTESLPNEGSTEVISQESWIDTIDDTSHTTTMYSLGNTATKVSKELPNDVTLNHM
jgi:flagellar basal body-associated protein FliL